MTTARERRRPSGVSPLVALTPKVEALVTPPPPAADPAAPTVTTVPAAPPPATEPVAAAPSVRADPKVARTFQLRESLVREAQTAVLRTGQLEGGYTSLNALVTGAVERELDRLAQKFNDGVKFPPRQGTFRTGRPIGS